MTEAAIWRDAAFRRSSFSGSSGGNCVEVAYAGGWLGVRDSKNIGPMIAVAGPQGRAFLMAMRREQVAGTP